ncbi:MAG TPA: serine hydrolase [Steroidobacteraceae bacterium]|jgi:CubicO group peptidase (beta-lactamase class C family)
MRNKTVVGTLRFMGIALLTLWGTASLAAAEIKPPADLDAYAARVLKTFEVPGLAVAIVKDDKLVFAKGYGVRKLGDATPVDENTLFPIGSNTKAFTSALLASLVDAGKMSWDDPVYERLPGFQMYDPYVSHEMTIRDLLTHRSGMGLGEGDLLFWPTTTYSRDDIIYKLRFMKPASSFRSRFAYDNLMYIAAGQIIPAITGETWENYLKSHILDPLGMKTTTLSVAALKASSDHAYPHERVDGVLKTIPFVALDNAAPAGSINSSVSEMSNWLRLQLNRGVFPDGKHLFSEAQSSEMWTPQTILPNRQFPGSLAHLKSDYAAYGLGWGLRDYHGQQLVEHTGGVAGFVSRVMLVPEQKLGVVILTNAESGGAFDSILFHILDHYFGAPKTDWVDAFKSAEDKQFADAAEFMKRQNSERADTKPSLPPEKYAGVYKDAWYGPATIRKENGGLVFTLDHTPAAIGDLTYWQYDTFKAHWRDRTMEDAFLTFTLKPDGSIDHFTMKAVSPLADFSFDYQDLLFTPVNDEKH